LETSARAMVGIDLGTITVDSADAHALATWWA
jgi:hypothetical protein